MRSRRGIVLVATLWLVVSWRATAHAQADPVVEADTTQTDSTQAPGGSSLTNMARYRGQGGVAQLPDSLSTSNVGIRFMPTYLKEKILPVDPFQSIDVNGVGLLIEMGI